MSSTIRAFQNDAITPDVVICTAIGFLMVLAQKYGVGHFEDHLAAVRVTLYQLEAQVIAAILGFLIAAAAILSTAMGVQKLRSERRDIYKFLIGSFSSSMIVSAIALVYEVVAFISDQSATSKSTFFVVLGFVLFLIVVVRTVRAVRRLYQSLSI